MLPYKIVEKLQSAMNRVLRSVTLIPLFGYQKCHFQALLVIQARIAVCFVIGSKAGFVQSMSATHTFSYIIAREFQMVSAQITPFSTMDRKGRFDLLENIVETTGFYVALSCKRISVHRIAAPYNRMSRMFNLLNKLGQTLLHFICSHSCNQHYLSRLMIWI